MNPDVERKKKKKKRVWVQRGCGPHPARVAASRTQWFPGGMLAAWGVCRAFLGRAGQGRALQLWSFRFPGAGMKTFICRRGLKQLKRANELDPEGW